MGLAATINLPSDEYLNNFEIVNPAPVAVRRRKCFIIPRARIPCFLRFLVAAQVTLLLMIIVPSVWLIHKGLWFFGIPSIFIALAIFTSLTLRLLAIFQIYEEGHSIRFCWRWRFQRC